MAKSRQTWTNFHIFSPLNSERICEGLKLSPPLKPVATLLCEKFYSTINSVQNDEKMFTCGKYSQKMLSLCFSTQINIRHMFKMSAFGTYWWCFWVVNASGQWMRHCALFNAVPNVYLHNWKEWVMQQTKYCNNVITMSMSVSGRKNI